MDRRSFIASAASLASPTVAQVDPDNTEELNVKTEYVPVADPSLLAYQPTMVRPWDRRRVLHLIRRTGAGATPALVNTLLKMGPSDAVDFLVDQALAAPKIAPPSWMNVVQPGPRASQAEQDAFNEMQNKRFNEFNTTVSLYALQPGLHAKLMLFWHNHFVTQQSEYFFPQSAFLYVRLIQDYQLGSFKTLTYQMGLTPAMLFYLNNNQNRKGAPNTNYARELLELFTLGEGNGYTEKDIDEIARSITGYSTPNGWDVGFYPFAYDNGNKTIFGVTDTFDYTGVINLLFKVRSEQIARHLSRKLYRHFVYPNAPEAVIDQMAKILLENDFYIEPVLRALFKSRHFFDDEFIGSGVTSPYEYYAFLKNTFEIPDHFQEQWQGWYWMSTGSGQQILEPPNVAGWQGHRAWLNTNTLPQRWNATPQLLYLSRNYLHAFAKKMSKPNDPYALAREMGEYIIPVRLTDAEYTTLGNVLLGGTPSYEWNIDQPGAVNRIQQLIQYICTLPESHLN